MFSEASLIVPGYGLMTSSKRLVPDADILSKVVAVQQRAWKYITDGHEDEAVDAIISQRPQMNLDRQVLLSQLRAYIGLMSTENTKNKPIGWESEEDWKVTTNAMAKVNLVKPTSKPSDFYTNEFIQ